MPPDVSPFGPDLRKEVSDFSIVLGGPLFQLLRRTRLADDALALWRRRILVIPLLAWLPLLVLSVLDGQALGGTATVPFLLDAEVHVRFLLALPLLVVAEIVVHQRIRAVVPQFLDRELIPADALARFEAAILASFRLRNSMLAEVVMIAFIYVVNIVFLRPALELDATTWYGVPTATGIELAASGVWYYYVSLPIFQFLLLRWYFRLFIWMRFLWQVSRIDLCLVPTHPDHVGGLGFLGGSVHAFVPLLMAHGAMLAALLSNRIFYAGGKLPDFRMEILLMLVYLLCLVLGPLLVFAPQLARAKRTGLREYGSLAQRYVREFDAKWLRGGAPADERLMGSADIQSLGDLNNSLEIVQNMRIMPFTRGTILQLAAATLAPVAPLVLTMMSLEDALRKLLGMIF